MGAVYMWKRVGKGGGGMLVEDEDEEEEGGEGGFVVGWGGVNF